MLPSHASSRSWGLAAYAFVLLCLGHIAQLVAGVASAPGQCQEENGVLIITGNGGWPSFVSLRKTGHWTAAEGTEWSIVIDVPAVLLHCCPNEHIATGEVSVSSGLQDALGGGRTIVADLLDMKESLELTVMLKAQTSDSVRWNIKLDRHH